MRLTSDGEMPTGEALEGETVWGGTRDGVLGGAGLADAHIEVPGGGGIGGGGAGGWVMGEGGGIGGGMGRGGARCEEASRAFAERLLMLVQGCRKDGAAPAPAPVGMAAEAAEAEEAEAEEVVEVEVEVVEVEEVLSPLSQRGRHT